MAIGVILDFEGATLEQYDKTIELMGLEKGGTGGANSVFHWVAKTDNGIRVVDVWESREAFDEFARNEIGPKTQQAGIPSAPKMDFYDVHNVLYGVASPA